MSIVPRALQCVDGCFFVFYHICPLVYFCNKKLVQSISLNLKDALDKLFIAKINKRANVVKYKKATIYTL